MKQITFFIAGIETLVFVADKALIHGLHSAVWTVIINTVRAVIS